MIRPRFGLVLSASSVLQCLGALVHFIHIISPLLFPPLRQSTSMGDDHWERCLATRKPASGFRTSSIYNNPPDDPEMLERELEAQLEDLYERAQGGKK